MIQLCDDTLVIPSIIYTNCIKKGVFPKPWKRANAVPVCRKDCKLFMKNYRLISLLHVFGKIFEKILFNNLYPYLITNNLISDKQSGFKKGDSTVNQLQYICHEIFLSFDANPPNEARAVFLTYQKLLIKFGTKVWCLK